MNGDAAIVRADRERRAPGTQDTLFVTSGRSRLHWRIQGLAVLAALMAGMTILGTHVEALQIASAATGLVVAAAGARSGWTMLSNGGDRFDAFLVLMWIAIGALFAAAIASA